MICRLLGVIITSSECVFTTKVIQEDLKEGCCSEAGFSSAIHYHWRNRSQLSQAFGSVAGLSVGRHCLIVASNKMPELSKQAMPVSTVQLKSRYGNYTGPFVGFSLSLFLLLTRFIPVCIPFLLAIPLAPQTQLKWLRYTVLGLTGRVKAKAFLSVTLENSHDSCKLSFPIIPRILNLK